MSFGHRKLLLFDKKTHEVLLKRYECNCFLRCSYESCKKESDDAYKVFSPPPSQKSSHMPTILILMLCILGAAFVFLCYLTILRRYRSNLNSNSNSRRRNAVLEDDTREDFIDENHGPVVIHPIWYINTVGLQQSVIDSIAVFKYKKGEGLTEGTDCSVCLSEFQEDESLRLLPKCSHAFHINCIDTWLRSHKNCPLCRAPIVRDTIPEADESVLNNSGSLETTSADGQVERNEVSDDSPNQPTIGVENIGHSPNEEAKNPRAIVRNDRIRVLSDLSHHHVTVEEELQPVRRSVSVDAASASVIYAAVTNIHPVREEGCSKVPELVVKKRTSFKDTKPGDTKLIIHKSRKSFSFGRSLQKMPIRMKRSFSTSSKSSLPIHSRSQEIIQSF